jgi:hypothetical protein
MMPKVCTFLCLTIVLWPLPANAQPLFHYEHDWTVTIGEHQYGLREVVQTPGDFRRTQVWAGRYSFDVRFRAAGVLAIVLLPPVAMITFLAARQARISRSMRSAH